MPNGKPIKPPETSEIPSRKSAHGIRWDDCYEWLQEKDNPAVEQYLRDENAHTDAFMAQLGDLPDRLYRELAGRIEQSSVSAPYGDGQYIYQSRIEKGAEYRQYYRKPKDKTGDWERYFDAEEEARDKAYFDLAFLDISPDGRLLAYAIDLDGSELYHLKFRDLQTGEDLQDEIPDVSGEGEWDAHSQHYFFIREDDSRRPYQIYRHQLGMHPEKAQLMYAEPDQKFHVSLSKSQDRKYLFASSSSKETTEFSYLGSGCPGGDFVRVFARQDGVQYYIEHHDGNWLVRTNDDAPDYKLLRFPAGHRDPQTPDVLIPARHNVRLEDVIPFRNHLVLLEREDGLDYIRIRNLTTNEDHRIETADSVYDIHPGVNAEFETDLLTFVYSSPIRPQQTVRYHMDEQVSHVIHSVKVPSGHTAEDYETYRITVPSYDGISIPVTIIHRKGFCRDGTHPLYLYAYGAYGISVDACFRSTWLSFLERGFAVAIAHVRGGGLLGEHWYQSGKLHNKENSFRDFLAVAEELIRRDYTRPSRLFIEGGSAGGLLIGAVLNMRPELFRAAVADVPFVDVLNTMLDASLPLTTHEYEEWGNPEEKETFHYIRSYSPYENTGDLPYPAILAIAGFNDPRVPYWESAKWIASIRKRNTGTHPILLKTCFDSGHAGASGRYGYLKEVAFKQAFLISQAFNQDEED